MKAIPCPECSTTTWRCVERGRYDEYLYAETIAESGIDLTWSEHDEYETMRSNWWCINEHEAPEEIQNELEERVMNA